MSDPYRYLKGVELGPAIKLLVRDYANTVRDLDSGFTFALRITQQTAPSVLLHTKTTGISGYSAASAATTGYNCLIDWETADHADLPGDTTYVGHLTIIPTSGDPFPFSVPIVFRIDAAPVAA